MTTEKTPKFYMIFSAALLILGALFLRESEGRAAAEAKAKTLEEKLQSVSAEKSTLVEDLEAQISQLENRLKEAQTREQESLEAHEAQVSTLNAQMEQERAAQAARMADKDKELEASKQRSEEDAQKWSNLIQEKSAENQGMAADLEKASQKYTVLLQKKDALESRGLELERQLAALNSDLEACRKSSSQAAQALSAGSQGEPEAMGQNSAAD